MSKGEIIFGIFLFAVATSILYLWGLNKSVNQKNDLMNLLYRKSANKVMHYLKNHESISLSEMEAMINNIKASVFYSRHKAVVTDPHTYAAQLSERMTTDNLIVKTTRKGHIYFIPGKKEL